MLLNDMVIFVRKFRKRLSRYGIGLGMRLSLSDAIKLNVSFERLHLGCGNIHIKDWCNVDVIPTGATDLVLDISSLIGLDGSASFIYSCHVLEHFPTDDIPKILKRWFEVLVPGGEIRISVPDLDSITRIYQKNLPHFHKPGHQPWVGLIYGGQKDAYDFHKTGFNFCWLKYLLEEAGFVEVSTYPNDPHFIPGVIDNSLANEPFGEFISLNVIAKRPVVNR